MLDELHVKDIALIGEAEIRFAPGLTVLTGETGAGKTAMLSALSLIRGERGDSGAVREGSAEALVEARVVCGGDEHVLRRRLSAKGRSRCSVDGAMSTVAELSQAAASIRVHGQNESSRLVDPMVQLSILDEWIDPEKAHLQEYAAARAAYLQAARELDEFEKACNAATLELEFLRFTLEQIDKVNPQPGEYEQLEEELPRLQHAEQLAVAVDSALQSLMGDGAALDGIAQATRTLGREAGIDPDLDAVAQRLDEAQTMLEDTARDLSSYAAGLSHDPGLLEETLTRLEELSGIMRRFGPTMEHVFETAGSARDAISSVDDSPLKRAELASALEEREADYRQAAAALTSLRQEHAREFCSLLAESVSELAMKGAWFDFGFEELELGSWTDEGPGHIELMYAPSPASSPRPLARIASGGELSRVSLAVECLHRSASAPGDVTLVFDEIDQGVGGATGEAVACRLAQLAQNAQVVVVTHLPQVAARADAHYTIEKRDVPGGLPHTLVKRVDGEERVAEIARMLSGTVDGSALEHARSLLAGA